MRERAWESQRVVRLSQVSAGGQDSEGCEQYIPGGGRPDEGVGWGKCLAGLHSQPCRGVKADDILSFNEKCRMRSGDKGHRHRDSRQPERCVGQ